MNIELVLVPYEDKTVLSQLIQLYRYDSSEFDGHVLNKHGLYLYKYFDHQWSDEYRRPFIIEVDGEIAGFVLISLDVPKEHLKWSTAEKSHVVSEFFIMRKYRRKGVGRKVAHLLFERFTGTWEVRQTAANQPAYTFWKQVISQYTNHAYQENRLQNENWNGPVFVFESGN
ncbi:GNAT family N-acetyltransferase [Paenibacillus glycanilyticus]|uniref:GNAT family N-acetyltransferase n=1 Tax=Paenibacillus glycanilyticus TaxID=126569 RepID=UPI00203B18F9|nr:GNAT family N-acetyltransferase [Paenibacillus glycanilyticus]MCM3628245.1 GNAT family N-acetyltransferase [Paenibacillus glycanilyticus]